LRQMRAMKKRGSRLQRDTGSQRPLVEALEWRRMCSGTSLTVMTCFSSTTVTQVAAGAGNLTVDRHGALWYTAADALLKAAGTGSFVVPAASDGAARVIVSNVVFTQDNSAWFVVAEGAGNRLERMTAEGQFQDVTPVTRATLGQLTVSQDQVWFTQSTGSQAAIGHIGADGREVLLQVPGAAAFAGLTTGPDGNVWFTANTSGAGGVVGRVTANGAMEMFTLSGAVGDIVNGQDGYLYFGGKDGIWRMDTSGRMAIKAHANVTVESLTVASDGSLWFIDASHPAYSISHMTREGMLVQYGSGIQGSPALNSVVSGADGGIWCTAGGTAAGWLGRWQVSQGVVLVISGMSSGAGYSYACLSSVTGTIPLNTGGNLVGGNTQVDVPVVPPPDSANDEEPAAPPSHNKPQRDVRVASVATRGSTAAGPEAATKAAGSAGQDPGTYEGEFCMHITAGQALPPANVPHTYYSSTRTPSPTFSSPDQAVDAIVTARSPAMPAPIATGEPSPQGTTHVAMMHALDVDNPRTPPAPDREKSVQRGVGRMVDWWRLTAYLSAVTGLEGWWPSNSRRL
jgi:virginiamycin B lyase